MDDVPPEIAHGSAVSSRRINDAGRQAATVDGAPTTNSVLEFCTTSLCNQNKDAMLLFGGRPEAPTPRLPTTRNPRWVPAGCITEKYSQQNDADLNEVF